MRRTLALATTLLALAAIGGPALAQNTGLPATPLDNRNMTFYRNMFTNNNAPAAVANSMAFFERRQADGTLRHYIVSANLVNGFTIIDITDPSEPAQVGRYLMGGSAGDPENAVMNSSLGNNWHAWVDVNPRRNIVALSIEEGPQGGTGSPGGLRHNLGLGVTLVDITDVTNPVWLSDFEAPAAEPNGFNGGPHTVRMIGDTCIYTSLNTMIIDYTDPQNPKGAYSSTVQGHEFYEDPNVPGRAYVGLSGGGAGFRIIDVSDCKNPKTIGQKGDPVIDSAHEVYPAPDSSYVGIADFTDGQGDLVCPGGGIHFYDISGKYLPGASLTTPRKMGVYHAPFGGIGQNAQVPGTQTYANYASCTMHSWQMQLERQIALGGLYAGGTWVLDPSRVTQTGGPYTEWTDPPGGPNQGTTTWGNTLANNRDALDYVNATQWWPFDSQPVLADGTNVEKLIFVNGWARGLDSYVYDGAWPKKMSRLRVGAAAAGGVVSGTLDRYAVLTYTGYANKPLAGQELTVSAEGASVTVTTAADGSFSANLGLPAGTHQVTVSWTGDAVFAPNSVTQAVTA